MSLKRLYLRIYNYSVQITFLSKIPHYLTVINEYIRRFREFMLLLFHVKTYMAEVTKKWRHPTHL